jgi:hypothetical protein
MKGLGKYPVRTILVCLCVTSRLAAYSVLTHEANVDALWPAGIRVQLLKRFPNSTPDELREAHAYAYGGAIIQDMGYYPFGSKFFSDLTHYVRSADFIVAMIRDSQDLNEYAFALGALAHYAADTEGHPIAINRTVPMMYPKLRAKYGNSVTYEDDPADHLKTEFAFDVVQVARGMYEPQAYHDFIGFQVSKPLLERAFQETYCLEMDQIFSDVDRALGTYRYSVSTLIPEMTKTAWAAKRDQIRKLRAGINRRDFVYRYSHATYHKEWDRKYDRPGLGARFLAWLFRILPKVGPLKAFAFKVPTPEAEKLFLASFDDTKNRYQTLLAQAGQDDFELKNENFDIGKPTIRGTYHLADETYDKLLEQLHKAPGSLSAELRADILRFYGQDGQPVSEEARAELTALKSAASTPQSN